MKLIIFGANGGTGRLVSAQALAEGHEVTVVTRHPEQFPLSHERLTVVSGDVRDREATERVIAGRDAVLSTLGVPYSLRKVSLYSTGTGNIVAAMRATGVRRLVCVSSSGTEPSLRSRDTGGGFLFEKVFKPIIVTTLGKTVYADMLRMERLVKASDLDWTIVRPGALFHTPEITDYRTADDFLTGQYTSRADLADCVLRQLDSDGTVRRFVAVATFDARPTVAGILWNEALQSVSR